MKHVTSNIPLYEGDEYPKRHWFICESRWEANDITSEDHQMAQFVGALQKIALTWYMTYIEKTPNARKGQIKQQFMYFFKTPDAKHFAAKKLKTVGQNPTETVREYDKMFKYFLIRISYEINENLLIQWFVMGLLRKNRTPLRLHEYTMYKDALKKTQQIDPDGNFIVTLLDRILE